MFEEMNTIELSGEKYPIKCDLLVLEKVQDKYGTIGAFEQKLMTWEPDLDVDGNEIIDDNGKTKYHGKFPDAGAVNDALTWMVNEGEAIAAEKDGRAPVKYEKEGIVRKVDIPLTALADALHDEFYRCFETKNAMTTQRKNQTEKANL